MAECANGECKDAIGVLNYNQTTRNEHLKRNGGLYALYNDTSYASIGEYYEIYFKTEEVSKSILNGKSISGYTHDGQTEYSKEIANQYFNGISNIETFSLEDVMAEEYPRWNGKRPEYIKLDVADGEKRLVSTPGDGAKLYYNGFLDNPSEALQETAKSTYDAAAKEITYAKPYVGFTWSDDGVSLSNGVFDAIDISGYDMQSFRNALDTTTHSMYADPDVAGTSVVVSTMNTQNEFDAYQGIRYGSNNLLAKTAEMFKNHKIKTLIGRFHTSNDSGSGNYNYTYDPFDSAKLKGLGNPHGRGLVKKEVSNGDYTYTDRSEDLVNGYFNPYCRSWTYHHQYSRFKDAIRPLRGTISNKVDGERDIYDINMKYRARFAERLSTNTTFNSANGNVDSVTEDHTRRLDNGAKYLKKNTVLQSETGLVRITPSKDEYSKHGFGDNDNTGTITDKNIKKYMFSIENLAWSDGTSLLLSNLSPEQRGPNNGRIMWFPPYNLNFSESVTVNWNRQEFIGRGEKVYTYNNTERKGNLTFTILIDHPAIANSFDKINAGGPRANELDVLRFFAGCNLIDPDSDVTDDVNVKKKDVNKYKDKKKETTPTTTDVPKPDNKIASYNFFVFFPNDYSGTWCNLEGDVKKLVTGNLELEAELQQLGTDGNGASYGQDYQEKLYTTDAGTFILTPKKNEIMYNNTDGTPHDYNVSYDVIYNNIISYHQYKTYMEENGAIDKDWFLYFMFGNTLDVQLEYGVESSDGTDRSEDTGDSWDYKEGSDVEIDENYNQTNGSSESTTDESTVKVKTISNDDFGPGYEITLNSGVTQCVYKGVTCRINKNNGTSKKPDYSGAYTCNMDVPVREGQNWSYNKNNTGTCINFKENTTPKEHEDDTMCELFNWKVTDSSAGNDGYSTDGQCLYYGTRQNRWSNNKLYYRCDFDLRQTRKTNYRFLDVKDCGGIQNNLQYVGKNVWESVYDDDNSTARKYLYNNLDKSSSQLNLNTLKVKDVPQDCNTWAGITEQAKATNSFVEFILALINAGGETHPFKAKLEEMGGKTLDYDKLHEHFYNMLPDADSKKQFDDGISKLTALFDKVIQNEGVKNENSELTKPIITFKIQGGASAQDSGNSNGLANRRKQCVSYTIKYIFSDYISKDNSNGVSAIAVDEDKQYNKVSVEPKSNGNDHNVEEIKRAKRVWVTMEYLSDSTEEVEDNVADKVTLEDTKTGEDASMTETADAKETKEINYLTGPNMVTFDIAGKDSAFVTIFSGTAYFDKFIEFVPGYNPTGKDEDYTASTKYNASENVWFPNIKVKLYKYDDFNYALRLIGFEAKSTNASGNYESIDYFEHLSGLYFWKNGVSFDDIEKFKYSKADVKPTADSTTGKYTEKEFIEFYKDYINEYFTTDFDDAQRGSSSFLFEVNGSGSDEDKDIKNTVPFTTDNNFKYTYKDVQLELYVYRDTSMLSQTNILNSYRYAMHPVSDNTGYDYSTTSDNTTGGTLLCLTTDFSRSTLDTVSVFRFCSYPVGYNKDTKLTTKDTDLVSTDDIWVLEYKLSNATALERAEATLDKTNVVKISSLDATSLKKQFINSCLDKKDSYQINLSNSEISLLPLQENTDLIEGFETDFDSDMETSVLNGCVPSTNSSGIYETLLKLYKVPYAVICQLEGETEDDAEERVKEWRSKLSDDKALTIVSDHTNLDGYYKNIGLNDDEILDIYKKMIEIPVLKNNIDTEVIENKYKQNSTYKEAQEVYKKAINIATTTHDSTIAEIKADTTLTEEERKEKIAAADFEFNSDEADAEKEFVNVFKNSVLPYVLADMYYPIIQTYKIDTLNKYIAETNEERIEEQASDAVNSTTVAKDGNYYGYQSVIDSLDEATCVKVSGTTNKWYITGDSYKQVLLYVNNGIMNKNDWNFYSATINPVNTVTTTDMAKNLIYAVPNGRREFLTDILYQDANGEYTTEDTRLSHDHEVILTAGQQEFYKAVKNESIYTILTSSDKFPDKTQVTNSSAVTDSYFIDDNGRLKIQYKTGVTTGVTIYKENSTGNEGSGIYNEPTPTLYMTYENYLKFVETFKANQTDVGAQSETPINDTKESWVIFGYTGTSTFTSCYMINESGGFIAKESDFKNTGLGDKYIQAQDTQFYLFKGYNQLFYSNINEDTNFITFRLNIFDSENKITGFNSDILSKAKVDTNVSAVIVGKTYYDKIKDKVNSIYVHDEVKTLTFNNYSDLEETPYYVIPSTYTDAFRAWGYNDEGYTFTKDDGTVKSVKIPTDLVSQFKCSGTEFSATEACLKQFFSDIEIDSTQINIAKDYNTLKNNQGANVLYEVPVGNGTKFAYWLTTDNAIGYKYSYTEKDGTKTYYCPLDTYIKFCGDEEVTGTSPKLIFVQYDVKTATNADGLTSTAETYSYISNSKYAKTEASASTTTIGTGNYNKNEYKYIKNLLEKYPTVIDYDAIAMKFYDSILKDKTDAEYYSNKLYMNSTAVGEYTDYVNSLTKEARDAIKKEAEEKKAKENNILNNDGNIAVRHEVNPLTKDDTNKVRIGNVSVEQEYSAYDNNGNPMRYDEEYRFFERLKEDSPLVYKSVVDKVKYFNPAYHSISPEGFNARLTFLQQCTRQGRSVVAGDAKTAGNLSFGKMPVCVLRIGDFINTKIIIDSMSINYQNGDSIQWDLNPEGVGVQPMFATVTLSIILLGGQSLDGPINRLQNAVTFNYYANAPVYDNRADRIVTNEDGEVTYEHMFIPGERFIGNSIAQTDINTSYIGGANSDKEN